MDEIKRINSNKQNRHCDGCKYQQVLEGNEDSFYGMCGYALITGVLRNCEAGKKKCEHYTEKGGEK